MSSDRIWADKILNVSLCHNAPQRTKSVHNNGLYEGDVFSLILTLTIFLSICWYYSHWALIQTLLCQLIRCHLTPCQTCIGELPRLWCILFMCDCCESVHASGLRFAQNTVWALRLRQRPWHQAVNCVHAQPTLLSSIPVSDGMKVVMVKSCQPGCLSLCGSPESLTVTERSHPERQLTRFCFPNGQTNKAMHLNPLSCLLGKGAEIRRLHGGIYILPLG